MKAFKYILILVISLVVIALVAALFVSKKVHYNKSITINAPLAVVWSNVNSLAAMDDWSPWNAKDPAMKKTLTGTDGQVGARQTWKSSNKEVGSGYQEISKITPPTYIQTNLKFYEPYESEAVGYIKLTENGANSIMVTWGFKSEVPYPFNIMNLFMDMENAMGEDWSKGLNRLKFLCEI